MSPRDPAIAVYTVTHPMFIFTHLDKESLWLARQSQAGHHALVAVGAAYVLATDVFAKVEQGLLRGVRTTSILGTEYNRFFGVPYAAPPVGDLRFRAPQPPSNWSGVRDALSEPLQCPQMWPGESSEDCLYLNVYAPAGGVNLPIMLMIYGGAFQGGSSSTNLYGPDFIVDHGVILVTFNYRSGVLGYLSLQTEEIPGNAGLKDAVAALRWVQRNGAAFGGDARRVTLFGASSGGCSVSHLLLSPATPGLFQQVIIQSGEAIAPWGLERNPREKAFRLAASMGFETDDLQELTQFLKAADALELTANDSRGLSDIVSASFIFLFLLSVPELRKIILNTILATAGALEAPDS
ncbi:esterase B1-like [Schistocerca cancellata]|uniref:esterase B1-like n=1 Tax=Schistocerca cancellata TaxID=274614 RepID=UPI0021186A0A|nr:esterase B1-like [Schistocerca cancellata]